MAPKSKWQGSTVNNQWLDSSDSSDVNTKRATHLGATDLPGAVVCRSDDASAAPSAAPPKRRRLRRADDDAIGSSSGEETAPELILFFILFYLYFLFFKIRFNVGNTKNTASLIWQMTPLYLPR